MNRSRLAIALAVGVAALGAVASQAWVAKPAAAAPLTTVELRKLAPLAETDEIRPTGVVREFTLTAKPGQWELVDGVDVRVWAYNGQVPGPMIRVTEGDTVRVTLVNELPEPTTIHWHGGHVSNAVDGVSPFSQTLVQPGERFTYEFTAWHAGTFMYHTHHNSIRQTDMGLYGPLVIDPQDPSKQPRFDRDYTLMLSGWTVSDETGEQAAEGHGHGGMGSDSPGHGMAAGTTAGDHGAGTAASGHGMAYNYWTINGKAFPDTEPLVVSEGERVRIRLINISNAAHPMHLHGHDFRVIAIDGHPVAAPQVQNTVNVAPGSTVDIEFIADNPGVWLFHCHELHHTANGETEPGGLIALVQYEGVAVKADDTPATEGAHGGHAGGDGDSDGDGSGLHSGHGDGEGGHGGH